MGKRTIAQTAKPANKKVKTDPVLESVASILKEAEHLPQACRTMLVEMLPLSLSYPANSRHELQNVAVGMVEETFSLKKSSLDEAILAEKEKMSKLKASEEELLQTVAQREESLTTQQTLVQTLKEALAGATSTMNASADVLAERRAAQKASEDKLASATQEKSALEAAFQTHFKAPMQEGPAGPNFKELEPFLAKVEIEPSLLTALPSSCAKSKEHRGTFDEVVLQELEKAISSNIAALGVAVETEGPVSTSIAESVAASEKEHEASKEAQRQAAAEFEAAQKDMGDREAALSTAKLAVDNFQPQLADMAALVYKAQSALTEFETGPFANFTTYKTRMDVPSEAAPAGA